LHFAPVERKALTRSKPEQANKSPYRRHSETLSRLGVLNISKEQ